MSATATPEAELLYSVKEAAAILRCSESHLRNLIREGVVPVKRYSERKTFIPRAAFHAWLESEDAA